MPKLKPCPFCGSPAIKTTKHRNINYADTMHPPDSEDFRFIWSIGCYNCGATFPNRYREVLLTNLWNTRPK